MKRKLTKLEIAEYYNHDYVLTQKVARGEMKQAGNLWYRKEAQATQPTHQDAK